jgi:GT2 family glycosyltransferase
MIDLLVVSHNTKPLLQRLLDTLHSDNIGMPAWTLYITDNGSTDGSAEFLTDEVSSKYNVKAGWCTENVGYAAACNHMAKESSSDILGLLNGDVWMTTHDVRKIEEFFQTHPAAAIVGPKSRNEKHYITHGGIVGTGAKPQMRGWNEYDPDDTLYRDQVDCVSVSGSAYFIRRSIWDELTTCDMYREFINRDLNMREVPGAFLPVFHYYEETWCSYHARAHGWKVYYDGTVSIGHTWHASSEVGSAVDQEFKASRKVFRRACAWHGIQHD